MGIILSLIEGQKRNIVGAVIGLIISSGWLTFIVDELNEELCENEVCSTVPVIANITYEAGQDTCQRWYDRGNFCVGFSGTTGGHHLVRGEHFTLLRSVDDTNHMTCCHTSGCAQHTDCTFEKSGQLTLTPHVHYCNAGGNCAVRSTCTSDAECQLQGPLGIYNLCPTGDVACISDTCECQP